VSAIKSSSSEDEERSTTGTTSVGDGRRPLMGTLALVVTQMAPMEESWCHWAADFPLQRESEMVINKERRRYL
jgi:hypothetical protein